MQNNSLIFGIVGFLLGGLLVSFAATTFEKPKSTADETSMSQMSEDLKDLKGDAYDEHFINYMIEHHEAAVEMAKLSESRAKHEDIKVLSRAIIDAQEAEIADMQKWRSAWGYPADDARSAH